jgi:NAD(P)-dependent dehydrogenase (short-subunit alcohol dehydrogenase family)
MNRLKDKVALITGSGSGIGRATAVLFAAEGAKVAVNDINEKDGQATVDMISDNGGESFFIKADVVKSDEVKRLVQSVVQKFDRIDVLHNNVGGATMQAHDTVVDDDENEWDRLIGLNLRATYLVSKHVVPFMIKQNGGAIINTITTNAYMNYVGLEAYATAKGALRELTRSMCLDYAKFNIRVNGLAPGETRTPHWEAHTRAQSHPEQFMKWKLDKIPAGRFAQPEDIALGVLFLASDDARYVNGHVLFVDGGLTAGFYAGS